MIYIAARVCCRVLEHHVKNKNNEEKQSSERVLHVDGDTVLCVPRGFEPAGH